MVFQFPSRSYRFIRYTDSIRVLLWKIVRSEISEYVTLFSSCVVNGESGSTPTPKQRPKECSYGPSTITPMCESYDAVLSITGTKKRVIRVCVQPVQRRQLRQDILFPSQHHTIKSVIITITTHSLPLCVK
jgi:hypothetical protein